MGMGNRRRNLIVSNDDPEIILHDNLFGNKCTVQHQIDFSGILLLLRTSTDATITETNLRLALLWLL